MRGTDKDYSTTGDDEKLLKRKKQCQEDFLRIDEVFERQIFGKKNQYSVILKGLSAYKLLLQQFKDRMSTYPEDKLRRDEELKGAVGKISDALECLSCLEKSFKDVYDNLFELTRLIESNTDYQAIKNLRKKPDWKASEENLRNYKVLLSSMVDHPAFKTKLLKSVSAIQAFSMLKTPQCSQFFALLDVLQVIRKRIPASNFKNFSGYIFDSKDSKDSKVQDPYCSERCPIAFLSEQVGDMLRFYGMINLCVESVSMYVDDLKTCDVKSGTTFRAQEEGFQIAKKHIAEAARVNNNVTGRVAEIKKQIQVQAVESRFDLKFRKIEVSELLSKWGLSLREHTKAEDSKKIKAQVMQLEKEKTTPKTLYDELLTELRTKKYDSLRACTGMFSFSRYRTRDTDVQTSKTWSEIEDLLLRKP